MRGKMRISLKDYPIDIILCIVWSIILLPIALLEIERTIRTILGLPFILFIPGYILIFALYPNKKTDKGIDIIERIALSFGLSIAVIPLIGLGLNYSPWGIQLEPVLLSIFIFIIGIGAIAIYRWIKTNPSERFTISLELSLPKSENKLDKALIIILVLSITIAAASIAFALLTPKTGEKYTELYILGPDGKTVDYPENLTVGENGTVIIGLVNHEYETIDYIIEVWLINQTIVYNETIYNHVWFIDNITVTLNHKPVDIAESWKSQWEYDYTFNIYKKGDFKLAFLLFTKSTELYNYNIDYYNIIEDKINNAYRETHLFITVT